MITCSQYFYAFTLCALLLLSSQGVAASACGTPATPMSEVQGHGDSSPLVGRTVTVEGILTLDARMDGGFKGFYLQQADSETDSSAKTSEALFVYTSNNTGTRGTRLRVTGRVKEFHGLTELTHVRAVTACGSASLPKAQNLALLWPKALESLENMRVKVARPLTVIDSWGLARYGELTLAADAQIVPTEYLEPGPQAAQAANKHRQQRLLLDDGRGARNPHPIPWPPNGLGAHNTIRTGDQVRGLSGILDYRFGAWRIQPEATPVFESTNPRPSAPERSTRKHVRLMTINLENYFNGDGNGGGFPTSRGAKTPSAYAAQHQRLVEAIQRPDPDILAVTELENDGYSKTSSIAQLAAALGPTWGFVMTPGADGTDQIRTGLLYRHDRVVAVAAPHRLNTGLFSQKGRPPLAQSFRRKGQLFTVRVVVPHLKSKSCKRASKGDRDHNDGQGCYAQRRTEAASAIVEWLGRLEVPSHHTGTVITGDLNSYYRETPLQVLQHAGFTSMLHQRYPCTTEQCNHYTYRYKGEKGSLDYVLASPSLKPRIVDTTAWIINTDEPSALGYKHSLPGTSALPWRSSDHNPLITDIRL